MAGLPSPRKTFSLGLLVFLVPLALYALTLNGVWASDHPTSFIDLDWAIYAHHSFVLGKVGSFTSNSVDIFQYRGDYYSALAPGTAILAFPFVALGFATQGGFTLYGNVLTLSELFVALTNSLAAFVLYRTAKSFFCGERAAAFIACAYAFSTISWPFATWLFQSDVSALFVLLGVYFALDATRETRDGSETRLASCVWCGLALGTAVTVDYVTGFLLPIFLLYLLWKSRGPLSARVTAVMAYVACAMAGVLLILAYNAVCFGNALTSSEQLYLGGSGPLSGFSVPLLAGLVLNFFTPLRGVFFYSPLIALAVWAFYLELRGHPASGATMLALVVAAGIVIPYSMWYDPTGGNSYGPRFLVPALPLLLLPVGRLLDGASRKTSLCAYLLYGAGVVINGLASLVTAVPPQQDWLVSPFVSDVLPDLVKDNLDTWWKTSIGGAWPVMAFIILGVPLLVGAALLPRHAGQGPGLSRPSDP